MWTLQSSSGKLPEDVKNTISTKAELEQFLKAHKFENCKINIKFIQMVTRKQRTLLPPIQQSVFPYTFGTIEGTKCQNVDTILNALKLHIDNSPTNDKHAEMIIEVKPFYKATYTYKPPPQSTKN